MEDAGPQQDQTAQVPVPAGGRKRRRRAAARRSGISLTVVLTLVALALGFGFLTLAHTGTSLRLPVWSVAEIESRLNDALAEGQLPRGSAISIGSVELGVGKDYVPALRLQDLRLVSARGRSLLSLPEAHLSLDPAELSGGKLRPSALRLVGAQVAIRRSVDGRIDLQFGGGDAGAGPKTLAEVLAAAARLFEHPSLSALQVVEVEALSLELNDLRAGRRWQVGDGRLSLENRPNDVAAQLALSLLEGDRPAQATVLVTLDKATGGARLAADIDRVAAADVASMAPPLAFLALLDAPLSGEVRTSVDRDGGLIDLSARLDIAAGSLAPGEGAKPIAFDSAALSLGFDPASSRIQLTSLALDSASLRLRAKGHGDLIGPDGGPMAPGSLPSQLVAQISFAEVKVDPEGLFEEPVRFGEGALDLRLMLDPFRIEIGQLALVEAGERLLLSGAVEAGQAGWSGGLEVTLDQISTDRLARLWPVSVVPRTRTWFAENVGQGRLSDVHAALRLAPGSAPQLTLGYEFSEAEVRFVRTLPPVLEASGHATLDNVTYTVVLDRGHVLPPEGGRIEADGSVFQIADISQRPATAKIELVTSSPLTATLSLLDQPPFSFFSKAGQPVNLGSGRAELRTTLILPLAQRVTLPDVSFVVSGRIVDFASPSLVPGRVLRAPEVQVAVTTEGLELSGAGTLDQIPVDLTYVQGFGAEQRGRARVNGTVTLSEAALQELGIELPRGSVQGEGPAAIDIALVKDRAPELTLISNLTGLALRLDALGWSKPAGTRAALELEASLTREPVVERLRLAGPGLTAEGRITTREGGGLDEARFSRVVAGDWMDAPVVLTGNGRGQPVDVAVTGGQIDVRRMPRGDGGAGGDGGPISLALDRLVVSEGITLTDFRAALSPRGGLNGQFNSSVNGAGAIRGAMAPAEGGTAFRITSDNAGRVMAAAGIFEQGRGGELDLTLVPRGPAGHYDGRATFADMRVEDAPALAELLSAISVVGLLEQLGGEGLAFSSGDVRFILTPEAVEITQGSAVGASLGISFAGLYQTAGARLDLQGVVSPIYLVNGLGQIFSRPGEGLFGFNYRLSGSADDPAVSVNPLSVFTPGMFREIFRSAPPNLRDAG
jgi:hypothetical protein